MLGSTITRLRAQSFSSKFAAGVRRGHTLGELPDAPYRKELPKHLSENQRRLLESDKVELSRPSRKSHALLEQFPGNRFSDFEDDPARFGKAVTAARAEYPHIAIALGENPLRIVVQNPGHWESFQKALDLMERSLAGLVRRSYSVSEIRAPSLDIEALVFAGGRMPKDDEIGETAHPLRGVSHHAPYTRRVFEEILEHCPHVRSLDLSFIREIADADVARLRGRQITNLKLNRTRVTDQALTSLTDMPLENLTLLDTAVTETGLRRVWPQMRSAAHGSGNSTLKQFTLERPSGTMTILLKTLASATGT